MPTPGPASPQVCIRATVRAVSGLPSVAAMVRSDCPTGPLPHEAAAFARAAGMAGMAANALLAGFFASRAAALSQGEVLGPANDLVGSLASGLMIPVAVALRPRLPEGRAVVGTQVAVVAALGVLTVNGPLLVLGVVPFEISTAVSIGAAMVLAGWLVAANRWMRRRGTLRRSLAQLGELVGGTTLVSFAGVGLALVLLPRSSTAQVIALVVAGVPGLLAWIATPVWFLRLGRPSAAVPDRPVDAGSAVLRGAGS
jgi:hypothetical protein